MKIFATTEDVVSLWRKLSLEELERAEALIEVISDTLRVEAERVGKDLDELAEDRKYLNVLRSVIVDVVARTLMTSTNQEPMTNIAESALGYSYSGTFLTPGGGLFIKRSELEKLGLRRQRYGVVEIYDIPKRDPNNTLF